LGLTKKQQQLLEQLTERQQTIEQHFKQWITWKEVCEVVGWEYSSAGNVQKRQQEQLAFFVDYQDNNEAGRYKRYMLLSFTRTFSEENFPINNKGSLYLQENSNEKRYELPLSPLEAMRLEHEARIKAMEKLNDDTGATPTRIRKAIAKSIVQNLMLEQDNVVEGEFRQRWYVRDGELLKATGLVDDNLNNILSNVNRFVCSLDLQELEKGNLCVIGLPKKLQAIDDAVRNGEKVEETLNEELYNYMVKHNIVQIAEIIAEEAKLQLGWVQDRIDSALKYLWSDLRLIETYEDGWRMWMKKSYEIDGKMYEDWGYYYPTMEEMDWINSQFKVVMSKVKYTTKSGQIKGYTSWWKLCEAGRKNDFFKEMCKHINQFAPRKFRWGTVRKVEMCRVLAFARQQVEYELKNELKLTAEEKMFLQQVAGQQKTKIRKLVAVYQQEKVDQRHQDALEGKVRNSKETAKNQERRNKLIRVRSHKLYPKLAKGLCKIIRTNDYKYYKKIENLDCRYESSRKMN
jgi:hypothetical protein